MQVFAITFRGRSETNTWPRSSKSEDHKVPYRPLITSALLVRAKSWVSRWMDGQRKCGMCIPWSSLQTQRRIKSGHWKGKCTEVESILLRNWGTIHVNSIFSHVVWYLSFFIYFNKYWCIFLFHVHIYTYIKEGRLCGEKRRGWGKRNKRGNEIEGWRDGSRGPKFGSQRLHWTAHSLL